jgi:nucleoside-diphosphate-sugar epimerase
MNSSVDLTEIRNLGWMPQASLEEGLKKMVESLSKE